MDTMIQCECGEEATINVNSTSNDYECTHCGNEYSIKYGKYTQRDFHDVNDVYSRIILNRREFVDRNFRKKYVGYW